MKLLIVSDTHDNLSMIDLLSSYLKKLAPDLLIHLGDYVSPFTLRRFTSFNIRLLGVFGNNDGDKTLIIKGLNALGEIYDQPYEVDIDGIKMLLLHGFGSRNLTDKLVNYVALGGDYNLILYGHTHIPRLELVGNTLVLNPGTLAGYLSDRPTLAFIDTDKSLALILDLIGGNVLKDTKLP